MLKVRDGAPAVGSLAHAPPGLCRRCTAAGSWCATGPGPPKGHRAFAGRGPPTGPPLGGS